MTPPTLSALRHGDAAAWRALFELYSEPLYRYAYHKLDGNAAMAEDVRQETFISAIQSIDQYREEAPLFGWLCGIARYKALDALRKQGRNASLETEAEDAGTGTDRLFLIDPKPVPEDCLVSSEQRAAVIQALWSLPEIYRQALVWRYLHDEPVDQIAVRLQKTYKSIESVLSRARSALRELLANEDMSIEPIGERKARLND